MKLTRISGGDCNPEQDEDCKSGDCPTVFVTDRGTVAVQGYVVDHATPDGEGIVEVPREILLEAARALGR
ncbi:hypothetical protein KGQ20_00700 [Catenulispora sp. NF23]|uniref:hypothetical protein n=1 Tax=Catenulispora pinistramenti TaxID=2705254 RepID=UPI001BAADCB5|nr:hypothetical protein [Catenulispora pinistramenti]MBS2531281.1 hypothetical protein [Catenulispora pinistramenti]